MLELNGQLHIQFNDESRLVSLGPGSLVIGRSASCDICLHDPKVSRRHLVLDIDETSVSVKDLNSSAGMTVDGIRVSSATLAQGSKIQIADTTIVLSLLESSAGSAAQMQAAQAHQPEYIEVVAGDAEPTVIESADPAEQTVSFAGLQQIVVDHHEPRIVVFGDRGTHEYILNDGDNVIGRDGECQIVLTDPAASRRHAVLVRRGDHVVLRDLDSKNGTYMRAAKVVERALFNGVNFRIGNTFLVYKAGFSDVSLTANQRQAGARRPVVVLPGIMGSELYRDGQLYWPNLRQTLKDPATISVGRGDTLTLGGIVKEIIVIPGFIKLDAYSELVDYLEQELGYVSGDDLLEFPYDWRQDNRDSAEKLKVSIDRWRREVIGLDTKFTILCHSMGALVSRYYLNCLGGADHVDKFVTLAGAHFGAPFVIQALMFGPNLFPLGIGRKNLQEALSTMPSAYQLVPPYPAAFGPDGKILDLHADTGWVQPQYRSLLRSAKEFHQEIGTTTEVPTTCIFGYGVKTVDRINVQKIGDDGGWEKVRFSIGPSGDNRVVDKYGYLQGSDIHPVRQHHGSLWNDSDVKVRIRMELLDEAAAR